MTDQVNPYSAPEAPLSTGPSADSGIGQGGVTEKTKALVAKAGPWATFLGVMGFVGAGFMVLIALASVFASGLLSSGLSAAIPFLKSFGGAAGGIIGLVYVILAVFIFFPSLFMVNIGSAAKKYRLRGESGDLERFVAGFKKWLKFYGITLIVTLSIYVLVIIIMIIALVVKSAG